jgi:hypothetical protein
MRDFEKLTRVRGIWERQARAKLGEANRDLAEADQAVTEAEERLREHNARPIPPGTAADLALMRMAGIATHDSYTTAELVRGHAERRSRAAQGAWRKSAQDLDVAEKLEERRKQAMAYMARRAAEATLDELMALRSPKK